MTIAVEDGGWHGDGRYTWARTITRPEHARPIVVQQCRSLIGFGLWEVFYDRLPRGAFGTFDTAGEAMRAVDDKLREMGLIGR